MDEQKMKKEILELIVEMREELKRIAFKKEKGSMAEEARDIIIREIYHQQIKKLEAIIVEKK